MGPGKFAVVKMFKYQKTCNTIFTHLPSNFQEEAPLNTDGSASLSGAIEQSHRDPEAHRSNPLKAHGTGSGQERHANHLLFQARLPNWLSPLASPSYYRSWDPKPRTLLASDSQTLEVVSSDTQSLARRDQTLKPQSSSWTQCR